MPKGIQRSPEALHATWLKRLANKMPPEEFARLVAADGALKWCHGCRELLPVGEFHKSQRGRDGLFHCCKACNSARATASHRKRAEEDPEYRSLVNRRSAEWRARAKAEGRFQGISKRHQLKTRYGLTPGALEAKLAAQDYRCAICRRPFKSTKDTHVDHDHGCCPGWKSCGECIRGILCGHCNTGLGRFHDSPDLLRRAARFIECGRTGGSGAPGYGQGLLWDDSGAALSAGRAAYAARASSRIWLRTPRSPPRRSTSASSHATRSADGCQPTSGVLFLPLIRARARRSAGSRWCRRGTMRCRRCSGTGRGRTRRCPCTWSFRSPLSLFL